MTASNTEATAREIPETSDLARLLLFLNSAGYNRQAEDMSGCSERVYQLTSEPGMMKAPKYWSETEIPYRWMIMLGEGIGYFGFYCRFHFAENGSLIAHGIWE